VSCSLWLSSTTCGAMASRSEPDAERGRALVDRLFECPRKHAESAEWEEALADLRVWSMAAWEPKKDDDGGSA
jgi:hypothetical protein